MSGYYEWRTTPTGKQPYYFTSKVGPILSIAGLWDEWTDIETGKNLTSCAMIITPPNKYVGQVHDRMPMLLGEEQFEPWLSAKAGMEILKPAQEHAIQMRKVSRRVNSSRADDSDPTLIEVVAA